MSGITMRGNVEAGRSHYSGHESVRFDENGFAFSVEFLFAQWWHVTLFHEQVPGTVGHHTIADYTANQREALLARAHELAVTHAHLVRRAGNCLGRVPVVLVPRGVIHTAVLDRGRTFCGKPLPEGVDERELAPDRGAGLLCKICPGPPYRRDRR